MVAAISGHKDWKVMQRHYAPPSTETQRRGEGAPPQAHRVLACAWALPATDLIGAALGSLEQPTDVDGGKRRATGASFSIQIGKPVLPVAFDLRHHV